MIGLHNVRCAELDPFTLPYLVTGKNYCRRVCDAVKSDICTGISYNMLPLPAMVEECPLSLKVKAECVSETSAKLCTHYTL
jgi:hypothetical protein